MGGGFLIFLVLIGMVLALGRGFWKLNEAEDLKKKTVAKAPAKVVENDVKPS